MLLLTIKNPCGHGRVLPLMHDDALQAIEDVAGIFTAASVEMWLPFASDRDTYHHELFDLEIWGRY